MAIRKKYIRLACDHTDDAELMDRSCYLVIHAGCVTPPLAFGVDGVRSKQASAPWTSGGAQLQDSSTLIGGIA